MNYRLSDLVDILQLQKLMRSFYEATRIPYSIIDTGNNILIGGGWQDICTKFHRVCPQTKYNCKKSDSYIFDHLHDGPFVGYKCLNGLMDYSTPIIVEGRHLASIFTGQFFHEPPDEEFFRRQAREYGFDETAYIEALHRVPIISKDQVETIMVFYSQLAQILAAMGLERIRKLEAADKALREREERLRLVLEESHDGFWDYNVETGEVYYSPRWIEMLGYSPEEIEPHVRTWEKLIHPDDKPAVMKLLKEHLVGQTTRYEVEYRLLAKSGEWKWILNRGKVVERDKHGKPLRMVGTHLEIAERKRAEEVLHLSEERFSKAFNASPIPVSISTLKEGRYIAVNESFLGTLGFSRKEVIGSTRNELNISADQAVRGKITQMLLDKEAIRNLEYNFRTKSGEIRVGLLSAEIINLNGDQCILSILNDISERIQFEKEMARMGRLNLVGEMAAGIGHEIRNPMTTVRGFLQMLGGKQDCSQYKEYYNLMISELDRANAIITEFLSLAKNKAVALKEQNLNHIVEALSPLIMADALVTDKSVDTKLENIPDLALDEKEMRQLVLNLVRNGLEAMSPGGKLKIKTFRDGDEVVLAVQDQGEEIKPDVLEKIGTPFFTTKDHGTGLGLAICFSIANRHNATVIVETSSAGTTFSVRFGL